MNDYNAFRMLSDSYKGLLADGKISKDEAEKEIRVLDFLSTCSNDDFFRIADSGALNDIIKAYCKIAIDNGAAKDINDIFEYDAKAALNYRGVRRWPKKKLK